METIVWAVLIITPAVLGLGLSLAIVGKRLRIWWLLFVVALAVAIAPVSVWYLFLPPYSLLGLLVLVPLAALFRLVVRRLIPSLRDEHKTLDDEGLNGPPL